MKRQIKLLIVMGIIFLLAFCMEEGRPYEILYSTILTSPNLTENHITLVVHSLLPIDRELLAKEIVEDHQRLNNDRPNPYYKLELYRTQIHYKMGIIYDTILCNGTGQIVSKMEW